MDAAADRWAKIYNEVPLAAVPGHYAGMSGSPFLIDYLLEVLRLCPRGGRTLETGVGSGYGAIWLSQRGINAEGMDYAPRIVERARSVNNILGGKARFYAGDLFELYEKNAPRFHVIHHQGVLEHFTVPMVRAALAQQVACADWVVFSVPSVNYPFDPEFGDERLLPIEEWERILAPFDVAKLTYYGDPRLGAREQILAVLRGQKATDALVGLMHPGREPYPDGISAIVHTRNEAARITDCLESLRGWTDEIIVCDMESEDATVEIAQRYTDAIIRHPRLANFDRARNCSAMRAQYRWVFYLDADERVPAQLGLALRRATAAPSDAFDALLIPFRHHFAGHWMQSLYPGYTAPRLLRNGKFLFNPRIHSGAIVDGRVTAFPADNPDLALVHYSFDSMAHYLDKLNRYTDAEAANMHRDGQPYHWQRAVGHFIEDFQSYYDRGNAARDGVHGFIYSFNSAFYRFFQHAKLYERRCRENQIQPFETAVPASVEQMLEYALACVRQKPRPHTPPINVIHITPATTYGLLYA
jgi:glycosyltransferase involved in cell wall biosynthesis